MNTFEMSQTDVYACVRVCVCVRKTQPTCVQAVSVLAKLAALLESSGCSAGVRISPALPLAATEVFFL